MMSSTSEERVNVTRDVIVKETVIRIVDFMARYFRGLVSCYYGGRRLER